MNAILVTITVFLAIGLFITVKVYDMADHVVVVDQYVPIEDSDFGVRFSTLQPSGVYKGSENTGELLVAGDFGSDWGAALVGDKLYINEYYKTDVNMLLCDVVVIDVNTGDKTMLQKNAILRGRCKSGELVCVGGTFLPATYPETNSLLELYSMTTSEKIAAGGGTVMFIDPDSAKVLYSVEDTEPQISFEKRYLNRTLEEVMR